MYLEKKLFALVLTLNCLGILNVGGSETPGTTDGVRPEKDYRHSHPTATTSTLVSSPYQPNNPFLYPKPPSTAPPYSHHQNPVQYPPTSFYPSHSTQPPYYLTTEQPLYFNPTPIHHSPTLRPKPTPPQHNVIDQYDRRYPDGSYEFRYEISDGTVRYERGYIIRFQHKRILVVRGYYSYQLPDKRFLTVFYIADQNGYRQESTIFSRQQPQLPRSIQVDGDLNRDALDSSEVEDATTVDGYGV